MAALLAPDTEPAGIVPWTNRVILAVTDDGHEARFGPVRDAAADLARRVAAQVVLYLPPAGDGLPEAGRPRLFDPLAGSPGPGSQAGSGRRHTGARRRDLLRDEAVAIHSQGPDVLVWLARRPNLAGIVEAVRQSGADLVLVPAERDRSGVGGRVVRLTLAYHAAHLSVPLAAVDRAGRVALVAPLGSAQPGCRRPIRVAGMPMPARLEPAGARHARASGESAYDWFSSSGPGRGFSVGSRLGCPPTIGTLT